MPIEHRARICLASWGNLRMTGDPLLSDVWVDCHDLSSCIRQAGVLGFSEGLLIAAFQLDSDGEVVTAFTPTIVGFAGMPGPMVQRDVLHLGAIPSDQQMAGYFETADFLEVGVGIRIQAVHKQIINPITTELPRWKTDAVDHQQVNDAVGGPLILVSGVVELSAVEQSGMSLLQD